MSLRLFYSLPLKQQLKNNIVIVLRIHRSNKCRRILTKSENSKRNEPEGLMFCVDGKILPSENTSLPREIFKGFSNMLTSKSENILSTEFQHGHLGEINSREN
ncbi:unnamed protein product [Allacma fusca]|uniref:Uncharacterized protein n=1 Tax=Allacma fusca TaxID=39272 RepID=A0A8J2PKK4_9HEXA|nr:unnamed protein product [Allacma fusca]